MARFCDSIWLSAAAPLLSVWAPSSTFTFMLDNEKVKVELGAHTDSRGAAADNQVLSQKRADASVAYIVSKGVAVIRIAAVGYGETQLLNKCNDATTCTETEHQQNRRIEIKIVCK